MTGPAVGSGVGRGGVGEKRSLCLTADIGALRTLSYLRSRDTLLLHDASMVDAPVRASDAGLRAGPLEFFVGGAECQRTFPNPSTTVP